MGAVEQVYEVSILLDNPTVAQIKNQREKKQRTSKAKAVLFAAVLPTIFYRIMTLKTSKEIWNFLKGEYKGNERIKGMQVLNLIREFELQKMKESETIKEYSNKLLSIVNNIKLLGTDFSNSRIVQKILVTILEKFETTISSLENSKDLSSITLAELLNALQAQEQRRLMRQERTVEGAFFVKSQNNRDGKNRKKKQKNKFRGSSFNTKNNKTSNTQSFPPSPHYQKKNNHPQNKCWWSPNARCFKCGQLGHMEKICKTQQNKLNPKLPMINIRRSICLWYHV